MKEDRLGHLIKALPQVPDILGRKEYFNSAVMMLLFLFKGEYHFIFQKRSAKISQGGEISFPGGAYDPQKDRSFRETAIRETIEELGISEEKLNVIGRLDTLVAPMGAIIEAYVGVADILDLAELTVNPDEVERVFVVPISHFQKNEPERYQTIVKVHPSMVDNEGKEVIIFPAQELELPERYHKPWGKFKNNVYVYRIEGQGVIWGITARFIYEIINKLT